MDRYSGFLQLQTFEKEGIDYRIRWRIGDSCIAVFGIHGGSIEPGTSQIADAIAGCEHTFYALEGIKRAGNSGLHITSTAYDEPTALHILSRVAIVLSIHGCAETEDVVYVGGLYQDLKTRISRGLGEIGFKAMESDGCHFQGVHRANVCNLCSTGTGVQLEISRGLRLRMFKDFNRVGKKHPTGFFYRFVHTVRSALEPFGTAFTQPDQEESTD